MKNITEESLVLHEPVNMTVNPTLKTNPDDPCIKRKIERAEQILSTLNEPFSIEKFRALHEQKAEK